METGKRIIGIFGAVHNCGAAVYFGERIRIGGIN